MQLDTRSPISIISVKTTWQLCSRRSPAPQPASFILRDFQKQGIALKGLGIFNVQFKSLAVIEGPYVSLLGMSWFKPLGLAGMGINQTFTASPDFNKVCNKFPDVFNGTLGSTMDPISLQVDSTVCQST